MSEQELRLRQAVLAARGAWRWGGPGWRERSGPGAIAGVEVTVRDPARVSGRWREVLGVDPRAVEVEFASGEDRGPTAIRIHGRSRSPVEIGGVRFEFA